jgi:hypothetical protein
MLKIFNLGYLPASALLGTSVTGRLREDRTAPVFPLALAGMVVHQGM